LKKYKYDEEPSYSYIDKDFKKHHNHHHRFLYGSKKHGSKGGHY